MNTPVNFEIAKLLKEKGFDKPCTHHLLNNNNVVNFGSERTSKEILENLDVGTQLLALPTIAEVVMWLYEKYEIWIEVSCHTVLDEKDDTIEVDLFYFIARKLNPVEILYSGDFVNSPTEAYLAAIEYTLENIK